MGVPASQVTHQDLARSIYDMLSNIPALLPEEATPLPSWCGSDAAAARGGAENPQKRRKRRRLEAQVACMGALACKPRHDLSLPAFRRVLLSPTQSESTVPQPAQENGGDGLPGAAGGARAKWASAVLQRRAWSAAWLALLRMPLPQDILRKVHLSTLLAPA